MADEATLADTVIPVGESQTQDTKPAEQTTDTSTTASQDTADQEAAEIGRIMLGSGVTKEQINDLLQAPKALEQIRSLYQSNPKEFLNMLQRNDPNAWAKLEDTFADEYVQRYGDKAKPVVSNSKVPDELMQEIQALREKTTRLETEQQRRDSAAAMAQVKGRYEARVDDMFSQLPKDMGLTKAETKALRAQLSAELSNDPSVVQRVSNGNFVDVPRTFKGIIDGWVADKKAAADEAKNQRERSSRMAYAEFPNGPQPFMVDAKSFDGSWDDTEAAFAKGLEQYREK